MFERSCVRGRVLVCSCIGGILVSLHGHIEATAKALCIRKPLMPLLSSEHQHKDFYRANTGKTARKSFLSSFKVIC